MAMIKWSFFDRKLSTLPSATINGTLQRTFSGERYTRVEFYAHRIAENRLFFHVDRVNPQLALSDGWEIEPAPFVATWEAVGWDAETATCPVCSHFAVFVLPAGDGWDNCHVCMCDQGHVWTVFVVTSDVGPLNQDFARMTIDKDGDLRCFHGAEAPKSCNCVIVPELKIGFLTATFYAFTCEPCFQIPSFQHFVFRITEAPDVSKTTLWLEL